MGKGSRKEPTEVSSKEPVSVLRQVVAPLRPKRLDPRFDRAFGAFHEDQFSEVYGFVKDIQQQERKTLHDSMQRERDPHKAAAIKRTLDRQQSLLRAKERQEYQKQLLKKWKKSERELVAGGKSPFYLKDADRRKLELVARYQDLKDKHRGEPLDIERLVEKRRKHKAARQHTKLPFAVPRGDGE